MTSNFAYLFLACLCVLLHPSTGGPKRLDANSDRIPIFLTASFRLPCSTFARNENCIRALDEGDSAPSLSACARRRAFAQQCRAVLEAMFNHQSDFARTPNTGSSKSAAVAHLQIHATEINSADRRDGVCCLFHLLRLVRVRAWAISFSAFLLMFQSGFLYVSLCSLPMVAEVFLRCPRAGHGNSCVTIGRNSDK